METRGTSRPLAGESGRPGAASGSFSGSGSFSMIDVGLKRVTRRRALAQGRIRMAPATLARIRDKDMPKGDVLAMAEVAGILAAKSTPSILPLCHPLALDSVRVRCVLEEATHSVLVTCETIATAKTGVEMEALTGASAALLSIYDLTKIVDPALVISDIRLNVKEGGKSGLWVHPEAGEPEPSERAKALAGVRAGVITVSDRCSRGEAEDRSGPALASHLEALGAEVGAQLLVPDEIPAIQAAVQRLAVGERLGLVVTTGGTGLGPRDLTPEALVPLFTKRIPGLGEALRVRGAELTPMSWLSRSDAGLVGETLVVLLPGSPKAVAEGMAEIGSLLAHAIAIAGGGRH
ncbi:MAG: bifunctional molybdenum cofactor biosynthesis protein MoaC/MoaB [Oligoflexia bacterium]|nr:bifunctional molybdenum cofactor biosynthesis protein MoaC/MoaB [Oligoflexia bacterium]